jgi:hypothetical protein
MARSSGRRRINGIWHIDKQIKGHTQFGVGEGATPRIEALQGHEASRGAGGLQVPASA